MHCRALFSNRTSGREMYNFTNFRRNCSSNETEYDATWSEGLRKTVFECRSQFAFWKRLVSVLPMIRRSRQSGVSFPPTRFRFAAHSQRNCPSEWYDWAPTIEIVVSYIITHACSRLPLTTEVFLLRFQPFHFQVWKLHSPNLLKRNV